MIVLWEKSKRKGLLREIPIPIVDTTTALLNANSHIKIPKTPY
jgi:hypothetical protein